MSEFNHDQKTIPVVALFLTAPVKPVKQTFEHMPSESNDCRIVPVNSIVMVVADKDFI